MQSDLRRNPKRFWAFVNSKRNVDGLPCEMHLNDRTANSPSEKCDLFATHFKQVFNSNPASHTQIETAVRNTSRDVMDFDIFQITDRHVTSGIKKLKYSLAVGPDGVPSCVLKKCSEALLSPLTLIFNLSLQQHKFPTFWKSSFMFPVHKKDDKRNVANYRGITSLCACSKVLEIIVHDALFASCRNYISPDQHGFFPKRSVSTNLTQFVSFCIRAMDSGGQVDTIYTDFKAAFDRVDHGILLARLEKLGVSRAFTRWFRSYLTNRKLCVKIGSVQSESFTNSSGVPQGSNLGPLMFSLFINELSFVLPAGCRLFYADDLKIFMVIRCLLDCLGLQHLIDVLDKWCLENCLILSIHKCNVITFHRKQKPIVYDYIISGHSLERVDHIRDLGVNLDRELNFRLHYNIVIAKANRQLGFIFKIAKEFRDPFCLRSLYCALVRSHLESSVVVWCPFHASWIARIEAVQRKFVRYALRSLPWRDRANLPPYEARCQLFGMQTLERRRSSAQAIFVAKVLTGDIDSSAILADLNIYAPGRILRTRHFLHLGQRNAQYGLHDPIRFMSNRFNEVYELFDFNMSAVAFQRRLYSRISNL